MLIVERFKVYRRWGHYQSYSVCTIVDKKWLGRSTINNKPSYVAVLHPAWGISYGTLKNFFLNFGHIFYMCDQFFYKLPIPELVTRLLEMIGQSEPWIM